MFSFQVSGLQNGPLFLRSLLIGMTLLVAGCTVGPDYRRPTLLLPETWSGSDAKDLARPADLALWWKSFNDPELNSLIERAIVNNKSVTIAQARVRQARAYLREKTATLSPAVSASSSATKTNTASSVLSAGEDDQFNSFSTGFSASWEVDLFGGKRRAREAAKYGLDASNEELRNTILVLIGDVAENYMQARAAQARTALAARTAKSQRQTALLTQRKHESGSATIADAARADAQAAMTESDLPAYEIARSTAVNRLGVLLGLPPAALATELTSYEAIHHLNLPMRAGIPADVLLTRPDVRMAERQLAQSNAKIGVAQAARYPAISLTGSIASSAFHVSDFVKGSTIGWSVGPAITVPLFEAGRLKAAVDVAEASRDEALAVYEASVLTAMEEVENAIITLSQQRRRSEKLAKAVDAYRRADKASKTLYEAGSITYLELLDGQRQLYAAESSWIDSQLSATTAYIALNKALGGGWNGEIPNSMDAHRE
ncbi:efflux transporter outer membrane subunit [uncultured Cohaesibacter sp.]|uniref:efflux transporter outer membrane subunit n=1 Tax=uncultured Cohaesibacter sp. TaxID=1002546 RepID=UPI0029C878CF|nr:efflux transporter outer membrane subunit [uncultured Cohaesibacter sp.]